MTDKELTKWICIMNARKRLPFILKEVEARWLHKPIDDLTRLRIKRYIDTRLEKERKPERGERERVYALVRVLPENPRQIGVELIAASEMGSTMLPKGP